MFEVLLEKLKVHIQRRYETLLSIRQLSLSCRRKVFIHMVFVGILHKL
jgi:hypothetical protein